MDAANERGASRRRRMAAGGLALVLAGCTARLAVTEQPSPNQDDRIRFLVLHYTDEDLKHSLDILTSPGPDPVSVHYVVSAPTPQDGPARVYRLVDEARRAWHAGESRWHGRSALNDTSIGIEIVYESHCPRSAAAPDAPHAPWQADPACPYTDYPPQQIALVQRLAQDILARHPEIDPTGVVGHSDIAPNRKPDPGPRFPWQQLAAAGVGAWYDEAQAQRYAAQFERRALPLDLLQRGLAAYGYGLDASGTLDAATRDVLFAFQTHFTPADRSALPDARTAGVLFALLKKYRPAAETELMAHYAAPRPDA